MYEKCFTLGNIVKIVRFFIKLFRPSYYRNELSIWHRLHRCWWHIVRGALVLMVKRAQCTGVDCKERTVHWC